MTTRLLAIERHRKGASDHVGYVVMSAWRVVDAVAAAAGAAALQSADLGLQPRQIEQLGATTVHGRTIHWVKRVGSAQAGIGPLYLR